MNKKKFLIDSLLNIFSTTLPLLVLQLVSLPIVANQTGSDKFGVVITVISVITVIGHPLGNVLNNIRLLKNDFYLQKGLVGDFNYLLIGSSIFSALLVILISIFYINDLNIFNIILLVLIVVLSVLKEYLLVSYRITLNFKGILLNNLLLSIGYGLGTIFFFSLNYWEIIYLCGLLASIVYIILTTSLLSEPIKKTKQFKYTLIEFTILYGAGLLKNFLNYADKIILLPILGPKNVSIYYAASIVGKIVSLAFGPINNVILSYLVKIEEINHKVFIKALSVILTIGIAGYFLTIYISPFFLNFFYPLWAEESLNLIYITSATAIVAIFSSVFQPFNLRYNKMKWQIYMSISNLIFFLLLTYLLTTKYGLIGFTTAVLFSSVFNFVFQLALYFTNYSKKK
ncbi:lipopolysaccharide biosynthesis protein [Planococcus citreus]|uniref:O-antigen/teichoic acid export membrane protein n=1 Tax=Planococcus citreus TaxID=1373 RepID=A0A497YI57_9BACL|nr:hypothetical protein [Planococcus citreus]RLJ90666.1 hypothetical protein DFR62_0813 [Planococcus citreus]